MIDRGAERLGISAAVSVPHKAWHSSPTPRQVRPWLTRRSQTCLARPGSASSNRTSGSYLTINYLLPRSPWRHEAQR
jgi:hypothetical protein